MPKRYTVRTIPAVHFSNGALYVVYDQWLGGDVTAPTPWREVAENQARKAEVQQ